MSADELTRLQQRCVPLEPHDGDTIFALGDPAEAVYAIVAGEGHVRIGAADREAKSLMVEVFRTGDIFGEIGVIDGGARSASAVAEGKVRVVRIPGTAFLSALAHCPSVGEALCRTMALRLRRTFELLRDATFENLEVRLARQIVYLAEREGQATRQGTRLAHRLRQQELADLLGATTRSIIKILNEWRAREIVAYDTNTAFLTVRDMAALRRVVTAEEAEIPARGPRP